MPNVVLGPACGEQAQQPDATASRPRKVGPSNGRRMSMALRREQLEQMDCRGCRFWQPFVAQWGHCGCETVRRHVDGEAPIVTKGSFSCKFFSPTAAARIATAQDRREHLDPPPVLSAVD